MSSETGKTGGGARTLLEQLAREQRETELTALREAQATAPTRRQDDGNALSAEYPVHDCLWQGLFGEIASRVGERSWPVWLGTYTALMARINRGLQVDYWGSLICGQPYSLMIGYSGSNKSLAARICRELMPRDYRVRKRVSSGPGLLEILKADQPVGEENAPAQNPIPSQPAILVMEEWTGLLKYAGLSGSVLFEDLCDLYHTRYNFNDTTKKRKDEGGDIDLERPTLSLLGTTTPAGFAKAVTTTMIEYGFINRHLILPCKSETDLSALRTPTERAAKKERGALYHTLLNDYLVIPASWGQGQDVEDLLTVEVYPLLSTWIEQTVTSAKNRYRDQEPPLVHQACIPRLDRHFLQICFGYAAATQSAQILPEHVEAAIWVTMTAQRFTEALVQDRPVTHTFQTQEHMDLDSRILSKVEERPGATKKEICLLLSRHAPYPAIGRRLDLLIQLGLLRQEKMLGRRKIGLWPMTPEKEG